jgi:Lrp/AsnC family transcriptional regulator, leucine-responsive regulatory protein
MNSKSAPDQIDWKILELLQHNARLSNTQVAKLVGLSQPAVTARIQRLEDAGVIEGYSARVNPKCLGREVSAFIRLKTTQAEFHHCLKAFERIPQILEIYRLTGEDCFIVKATFETMSQLESTIDTLAKHGNSTTTMILAPYPPRPLTDSGVTLDAELREELNFQGRR